LVPRGFDVKQNFGRQSGATSFRADFFRGSTSYDSDLTLTAAEKLNEFHECFSFPGITSLADSKMNDPPPSPLGDIVDLVFYKFDHCRIPVWLCL